MRKIISITFGPAYKDEYVEVSFCETSLKDVNQLLSVIEYICSKRERGESITAQETPLIPKKYEGETFQSIVGNFLKKRPAIVISIQDGDKPLLTYGKDPSKLQTEIKFVRDETRTYHCFIPKRWQFAKVPLRVEPLILRPDTPLQKLPIVPLASIGNIIPVTKRAAETQAHHELKREKFDDKIPTVASPYIRTLWQKCTVKYDKAKPILLRHDYTIIKAFQEFYSEDMRLQDERGRIPNTWISELRILHIDDYPSPTWTFNGNVIMMLKSASQGFTFCMKLNYQEQLTVSKENMQRRTGKGNAALAMEVGILRDMGYTVEKVTDSDGANMLQFLPPKDPEILSKNLEKILNSLNTILSVKDKPRPPKHKYWNEDRKRLVGTFIDSIIAL